VSPQICDPTDCAIYASEPLHRARLVGRRPIVSLLARGDAARTAKEVGHGSAQRCLTLVKADQVNLFEVSWRKDVEMSMFAIMAPMFRQVSRNDGLRSRTTPLATVESVARQSHGSDE
jgi:hypothetical protein